MDDGMTELRLISERSVGKRIAILGHLAFLVSTLDISMIPTDTVAVKWKGLFHQDEPHPGNPNMMCWELPHGQNDTCEVRVVVCLHSSSRYERFLEECGLRF